MLHVLAIALAAHGAAVPGGVLPVVPTLSGPAAKHSEEAPVRIETGPFRGIELRQITPVLITAMNLPAGASGVVVAKVDAEAALTRLQAGDILHSVNGVEPATVQVAARLLLSDAHSWDLTFERDGRLRGLSLRF